MEKITIAVFGDVHGEIDLVYGACRDWQVETGQKIDLILQVGDLGVYVNRQNIDPITQKKILDNPAELRLYDLLRDNEIFRRFLNAEYVQSRWRSDKEKVKKLEKSGQKRSTGELATIDAKLLFVDGNHDEHQYLDNLKERYKGEALIPINPFIMYVRDSTPLTLYSETGIALLIAGIGGIDMTNRPKRFRQNPRIAFTEEETTEALKCEGMDIFLTHMHPDVLNGGSKELSDLVSLIKPRLYFFGHNHTFSNFRIGETECFGLNRVKYPDVRNIKDGSLIILEKYKNGEIKLVDKA